MQCILSIGPMARSYYNALPREDGVPRRDMLLAARTEILLGWLGVRGQQGYHKLMRGWNAHYAVHLMERQKVAVPKQSSWQDFTGPTHIRGSMHVR